MTSLYLVIQFPQLRVDSQWNSIPWNGLCISARMLHPTSYPDLGRKGAPRVRVGWGWQQCWGGKDSTGRRNKRVRSPWQRLLRGTKTWEAFLTRTKICSICSHHLPTASAAWGCEVLCRLLPLLGLNIITRCMELAGTLQVTCSKQFLKDKKAN